MQNRRIRWLSGLGAVILSGGLLTGCGSGDDVAVAQSPPADLHGVAQNWDKVISGAGRFTLLSAFGNAAVRDNETGLVWEQSPGSGTNWSNARFQCTSRTTGGRKGWRLPSVHESASLVDPSIASPSPTLPAGHLFTNVQPVVHWSASTSANEPAQAWIVNFNGGGLGTSNKADGFGVWCVRGGMQESVY